MLEVVDNQIGIQFPSRTGSDISLIYIKHELTEPPMLALVQVAAGAASLLKTAGSTALQHQENAP